MTDDVADPAATTMADDETGRTLGLPQATSLVVGTLIGVGIVNVSAMALCLFPYIGVESASIAAAKVSDPTRNMPPVDAIGAADTVMTAPTAG